MLFCWKQETEYALPVMPPGVAIHQRGTDTNISISALLRVQLNVKNFFRAAKNVNTLKSSGTAQGRVRPEGRGLCTPGLLSVLIADLGSWHETTERATDWSRLFRAILGNWIDNRHEACQPNGRGTIQRLPRLLWNNHIDHWTYEWRQSILCHTSHLVYVGGL